MAPNDCSHSKAAVAAAWRDVAHADATRPSEADSLYEEEEECPLSEPCPYHRRDSYQVF